MSESMGSNGSGRFAKGSCPVLGVEIYIIKPFAHIHIFYVRYAWTKFAEICRRNPWVLKVT